MKVQRSVLPKKSAGQSSPDELNSQQLLEATLDSSFNFIQVFKAVRDQSGQIIDFVWVLTNRRWQQAYGDVIGKSLLELNPAVVQTGVFARLVDVTQTGVAQTHEHYYPFEQFNGWFHQTLTKLQDGVVLTTEDITIRKQAEILQAFLLTLSDALRPLADPGQVQQVASQLLTEQLAVNWVCYVEVAPDGSTVESPVGYSADAHVRLPPDSQISGLGAVLLPMYTAGKTVAYADVESGTDFTEEDRQTFRIADSRAVMSVPLWKESRLVALLTASSSLTRTWTNDEVRLAEEVAHRTWAVVERAKLEAVLREREARFRTMFESIDEGFHISELLYDDVGNPVDWRYLEVNTVFEQQTGLLNVAGQLGSVVAPNTEPHWLATYDQVLKTGVPLRFENYHAFTGRWYSAYACRVGGSGSHRFAVIFNDITDRKQIAAAEQEAGRRKDEFLAMLAHELRNPLATLHNTLLLLELTQGQDETLPLDRALAIMSREVGHLGQMVDDLLDVSRISQGKIQLKKKRLDLGQLVQQALESIRPQFVSRGQDLTIELPSQSIWVYGDATRLTQVIRNLATNAVKYTPAGGRVGVSLDREGQQAVLRVQDNGIGIAPEQLKAIFEVFVQVSSSLDRPQGGLGLGLTVAKQLVELHGGQVGVQSPGLGQGSEFTVRIPCLPDAPILLPVDTAAGAETVKAKRILVVDDNADLALTTAMLLRIRKYEADTCLSGSEALTIVASHPPDAVLLDLGMPGMDGYETCRRLRELAWGQEGIIVALTGYGQEKDKKRTQEAGFDGHLVKPVNLQTLTELLDRLLD